MNNIYLYIFAMALTTYLIRVVPLLLVRKKIQSKFAKSFFKYVPYAVLTAMTFPAIFTSANGVVASVAGFVVALVMSLFNCSLLPVSLAASLTAYLVSLIPF